MARKLIVMRSEDAVHALHQDNPGLFEVLGTTPWIEMSPEDMILSHALTASQTKVVSDRPSQLPFVGPRYLKMALGNDVPTRRGLFFSPDADFLKKMSTLKFKLLFKGSLKMGHRENINSPREYKEVFFAFVSMIDQVACLEKFGHEVDENIDEGKESNYFSTPGNADAELIGMIMDYFGFSEESVGSIPLYVFQNNTGFLLDRPDHLKPTGERVHLMDYFFSPVDFSGNPATTEAEPIDLSSMRWAAMLNDVKTSEYLVNVDAYGPEVLVNATVAAVKQFKFSLENFRCAESEEATKEAEVIYNPLAVPYGEVDEEGNPTEEVDGQSYIIVDDDTEEGVVTKVIGMGITAETDSYDYVFKGLLITMRQDTALEVLGAVPEVGQIVSNKDAMKSIRHSK